MNHSIISKVTLGAAVVGGSVVAAATAPVWAPVLGGVGLLGAAGTGTAISSLGGAALTSASVAAVGGAAGSGILGGSVAGLVATLGHRYRSRQCRRARKWVYEMMDEQDHD